MTLGAIASLATSALIVVSIGGSGALLAHRHAIVAHVKPPPIKSDEAFGVLILACKPGTSSNATCFARKQEFPAGTTLAECEANWIAARKSIAKDVADGGAELAGHLCVPLGMLVVAADQGGAI